MRVLHVIPTYVPAFRYGGPMRSVFGLADAQAVAGDRIEVFTTDADGPGRLDVPLESPVAIGSHEVRYFRTGFPRRLGRAPRLDRALRRDVAGFDVVHLHSVFLWPTWSAARRARDARRPFLVSPHGMLDRDLIRRRGALRKRLWIALVERRTLAESSRIVVTSPREAEEVRALGLDLAPLVEVAHGVDPSVLEAADPGALSPVVARAIAGAPYALILGRLSWKKGIDLAIGALSRLARGRLIVAGPDDEGLRPRLERLASDRGVTERVVLLDAVDGADRAALVQGARVATLPSASENFALAVLESLACGVPAVVSPGVGLAPAIEAAGAGEVVERDEESLARALEAYLTDEERARTAGDRGRTVVSESYSWASIARRMRAVYEEVVGA